MAYVSLGNPIWSCQFRLQGGRPLFYKAAVYGLAAIGLVMLYHRLEWPSNSLSTTALVALKVLAWVQVGVLLLGGAGAITKALTRDYTTKMIESYRISPMSSFTVVIGYLFGGPMQVLLLYGVGVVLGVGLSVIGSASPQNWLAGNVYLLLVSLVFWSIAVFVGVGRGKPGNIRVLLVLAGILSPVLMSFVPGLALLSGAYAVGRCEEYMLGRIGPASGLGIAFAGAILMLVFWSAAAARRYRKPHLPALSVAGALVFVVFWLLFFLVGMAMLDDLIPAGWRLDKEDVGVLVGTLLSPLVVAHLPAAAAAQMRRRHLMGAQSQLRTERCSPALASLLATCIVLLFVLLTAVYWGDHTEQHPVPPVFHLDVKRWGAVVTALVVSVWTVTGLLRLSQFTTGRSLIAGLLTVLLWAIPPLVDHLRVSLLFGYPIRIEHYSILLGCSPVASILATCVFPSYAPGTGLGLQVVVAFVATLLGNRAERILIARRARKSQEA